MLWVMQIDPTQTTPHFVTQVKQFAMEYYLTVSSLVEVPILAILFFYYLF